MQALGGIPLGFGIVVEDKPSELSYTAWVSGALHYQQSSILQSQPLTDTLIMVLRWIF